MPKTQTPTTDSKAATGASLAIASLAIVLLAGCSRADNTSLAPDSDTGAANAPNATGDLTTSPTPAPGKVDGPLDEFRIQIFGTSWDAESDPQAVQQIVELGEREMEEFIAACMAEQGFQYIMRTDEMETTILPPLPGQAQLGSREWAALFGFGISTNPPTADFSVRSMGITGVTTNRELRAEMSEAERAAWWQALYGVALVDGQLLFPQPHLWENVPESDIGCMTRWFIAQTEPPIAFGALQDEIDRFESIVQADPRTLALDAEWASCMIDAGEPGWVSPLQVSAGLREMFAAQDQIPVEVLLAWDWAAAPDGPPEPVGRAAFQEREIAIAVADWDCRDQLDHDAAQRAIDLDLQQEFVDQHRNELEAWVQYVAQGNMPARRGVANFTFQQID